MTKEQIAVKDILHLYGINCEIITPDGKGSIIGIHPRAVTVCIDTIYPHRNMIGTRRNGAGDMHYTYLFKDGGLKLVLRQLSSMTEEEAIQLHRITTPYLVVDWPADKDKYDVSYNKDHMLTKEHPNYGYIHSISIVDLRAPHDYMNINDRWDILRYNHEDDGEPKINERVYHQPKAFAYLLSKHFDIFGLIESGLAIDATTINNQKL